MTSYEKDLFAKFLHEGTFVVNNVMKRNILKLKFMTLPQELKDEILRRDAPQSTSLAKIQKAARNTKPKTARQTLGLLKTFTPRKSIAASSKFNIFSKAVQWIASRPGSDNPDLALAEKLMKASETATSAKNVSKSLREARNDFKISQAKCKIS